MSSNEEKKYVCVREKQISKHESAITELQTRANYREEQIKQLNENMKEMSKKLDEIKDDLSELKIQSLQDDSDIGKRVTALENTVKVLKWVSGISLTALSVFIAALSFAMMYLH